MYFRNHEVRERKTVHGMKCHTTDIAVSTQQFSDQCSRRFHLQAVYDNHRQEFVMSRAKVNYQRVNMALEGFRRMLVRN